MKNPVPRAFSAALEQAGKRTQLITTGERPRRIARNKILSELLWEFMTNGRAVMPDGAEVELSSKEWLDLVKWMYGHIDGPPSAKVDLTSGGKEISFKAYAGFDPDNV